MHYTFPQSRLAAPPVPAQSIFNSCIVAWPSAALSEFFNRTFTTTGNRRKWTISWWMKRGVSRVTTNSVLFWCGNTGNDTDVVALDTDETLRFSFIAVGAVIGRYRLAQKFWDTSAWVHFILHYDSDNATAADRVKLYVNGVRASLTTEIQLPINANSNVGRAVRYDWGNTATSGQGVSGADAKLADIQFFDGVLIPPTDLGVYSPGWGVWFPKAYTGTYPGNSHHLKFDPAAFMNDSSGNGFNFTSFRMNTTPGPNNSSTTDTPFTNFPSGNWNKDNVGGWLDTYNHGGSFWSLQAAATAGWFTHFEPYFDLAYVGKKIYFEFGFYNLAPLATSDGFRLGFAPRNYKGPNFTSAIPIGSTADSWAYAIGTGRSVNNGVFTPLGTGTLGAITDVAMIAYDPNGGKVWFGKNGVWNGDPATGASPAFTGIPASHVLGCSMAHNSTTVRYLTMSFGDKGYKYPAPTGFAKFGLEEATASAPTLGGNFTGNANADGPFVFTGCVPEILTINGNVVTWGTHARRLSCGFKVISALATYNAAGSNAFVVTKAGALAKYANAQFDTNPQLATQQIL